MQIITKNIENEFENQINNIEKINKYTENWKNCFNNKVDYDNVEKQLSNIQVNKTINNIELTSEQAQKVSEL